MPQLDLTTYSTLSLYSFIGFNLIYIFISFYFLTKLTFIFKYRNLYLQTYKEKNTSSNVADISIYSSTIKTLINTFSNILVSKTKINENTN